MIIPDNQKLVDKLHSHSKMKDLTLCLCSTSPITWSSWWMFKVLLVWAAIPTGPTPNMTELPPNDWNKTDTISLVVNYTQLFCSYSQDLDLELDNNNVFIPYITKQHIGSHGSNQKIIPVNWVLKWINLLNLSLSSLSLLSFQNLF